MNVWLTSVLAPSEARASEMRTPEPRGMNLSGGGWPAVTGGMGRYSGKQAPLQDPQAHHSSGRSDL